MLINQNWKLDPALTFYWATGCCLVNRQMVQMSVAVTDEQFGCWMTWAHTVQQVNKGSGLITGYIMEHRPKSLQKQNTSAAASCELLLRTNTNNKMDVLLTDSEGYLTLIGFLHNLLQCTVILLIGNLLSVLCFTTVRRKYVNIHINDKQIALLW